MIDINTLPDKVKPFIQVEREMNSFLFERAAEVRSVILASLSGTNVLLLGPAGVAKSALIEAWNQRINGAIYFSKLVTKFTTPEEILGPPSFKGLENEDYYRVTRGKLSEAHTAFLDEIFKANSSILNALLRIINERIFENGTKLIKVPLITLAGASNEIPDADDGLDAFFDRFLLKHYVRPLQESSNFDKMLLTDTDAPPKFTLDIEQIREAQAEIAKIALPENVRKHIIKFRDEVRKEGVSVSDRTFKVSIRILKSQAFLHGRKEVTNEDLELYKDVAWYKPEQERTVHSKILEIIAPQRNIALQRYQDCLTQQDLVLKITDPVKKQAALVDANKKIKSARNEIGRLRDEMAAKNLDTEEITKLYDNVERMMIQLVRNVMEVDEDIPLNIPE